MLTKNNNQVHTSVKGNVVYYHKHKKNSLNYTEKKSMNLINKFRIFGIIKKNQ